MQGIKARVQKTHKIATLNRPLRRKEDGFCWVTLTKKVKLYIQQAGQCGGAMSRIISVVSAVSVAKALLGRYESLGKVKITEA